MTEAAGRAITAFRAVNRFLRAGDLDDGTLRDLTVAQLRILFRLRRVGPIGSGALAAELGVTLPTVTSVIDRLSAKRMVARSDDPSDRRRVIVQLTDEGREVIERIQQGRRARLTRVVEALDLPDQESLAQALEVLAEVVNHLDAQPRDENTTGVTAQA